MPGPHKTMRCSDIQSDLTLFQDDILSPAQSESITDHLASCPLCRQKLSELQSIRSALRSISRPVMPAPAVDSIRASVMTETRRSRYSGLLSVSRNTFELIQMRLMPLGVGVVGSVLIGIGMLWLVLAANIRNIGPAVSAPVATANAIPLHTADPFAVDVDPTEYARARQSVAGESPSVNPDGALVALTRALVRGEMKDDEVVIVADVFSNGLAQIAEVVEPASNRQAVKELEKALETDPAFAPFVPAAVDRRSGTIRVVFKLQTVDVDIRDDDSGRLL